jgi:sugar lactone lactonase YvrE
LTAQGRGRHDGREVPSDVSAAAPRTLVTGLVFGEQPRWHDGRLWLSDWGPQRVLAVDLDGNVETMHQGSGFPLCVDWLPDGRMLVVSAPEGLLLRQEPDGSLVTHADLNGASRRPVGNELVVDGRGNAYVNGAGFDLVGGGEFAPGAIVLATPAGTARQVADDIAFPNGMLVTPDNAALIVADSYGKCLFAFDVDDDGGLSNRRVWADLGDGVPDGICMDEEGAVWYADVPNKRCVRVREGGEVLQTIEVDRGCFACALGGPDRATLFIVATEWRGPAQMFQGPATGQVLTVPAPAPGVPYP